MPCAFGIGRKREIKKKNNNNSVEWTEPWSTEYLADRVHCKKDNPWTCSVSSVSFSAIWNVK